MDIFVHKEGLDNNNQQTTPMQNNDLSMSQYQPPMDLARYYNTLSFLDQKAQIDVRKNQEIIWQRLEYEKRKNEIKIYSQELAKMISYEVSNDSLGRILYAPIALDKNEICSKVLLNVIKYKTTLLCSFGTKTHIVLKISWEGGDAVYLENGSEGISTRIFLKRLKAKGVVLRVSKRYESAVADALLSYSLNTAGECEIPWCLGWNKMENGLWHFAHENEITMKEVLKYV